MNWNPSTYKAYGQRRNTIEIVSNSVDSNVSVSPTIHRTFYNRSRLVCKFSVSNGLARVLTLTPTCKGPRVKTLRLLQFLVLSSWSQPFSLLSFECSSHLSAKHAKQMVSCETSLQGES